MYFVYVLQIKKSGRYYIGQTQNLTKRLERHSRGETKSLKNRGEFEVVYAAKETGAPSEIVIPDRVYPDGFYVWVSDGVCHYDPDKHVLYHKPSRDEPGVEHWVRILPPLARHEAAGWQYFFDGNRVIAR